MVDYMLFNLAVLNLKKRFLKRKYFILSLSVSYIVFLLMSIYFDLSIAKLDYDTKKFQENSVVIDHISSPFTTYEGLMNDYRFQNYDNFKTYQLTSDMRYAAKNGDDLLVVQQIIGIENGFLEIAHVTSNNDFSLNSQEKLHFKYGRNFFHSFDEVIISDELSLLLFETENSIGKKMELQVSGLTYQFTVAGVYQNTGFIRELNRDFRKTEDMNYIQGYYTNIYIPLMNPLLKYDGRPMYTYVVFNDLKKLDAFINTLQDTEIVYYDKKTLVNEFYYSKAQKTLTKYQILLVTVIIVGINVLGVTFKVVEERKREFGIYRAHGASRKQLFYLILIENLLYNALAILLSILVVAFCLFIYVFYQRYFSNTQIYFQIYESTYSGFILFSLVSVIGYTLLPAHEISKIDISEMMIDE